MSAAEKWSTPTDLRQQVQRWWDKGLILSGLTPSAQASGEAFFPRRLVLKTPTSSELTADFEAVRHWAQRLGEMPHIRLVQREFRHRLFGNNALPAEAWLDTPESAIALIGKQKEARIFAQLVASTAVRQAALLDWLAKRPLRALELADLWEKLLDVVDWIKVHPRPGIYLRQMDIPGVHSKFVEAQRAVLGEWLDRVLPTECIDATATGVTGFNQRYGFLDKPERVRFRYLDPACAPLPNLLQADLTLDASTFARLSPAVDRVFITENEINFLAFPAVEKSLLIFGAGYGFSALADAHWLRDCPIHYWGDIDTHGFAILDELRSHFPRVESLLMDRKTLLASQGLWGEEAMPINRDLPHLRQDEQFLYNDLRDQLLGKNLRLEQERIAFHFLESALASLC
mgnify:CR=1 FL=1